MVNDDIKINCDICIDGDINARNITYYAICLDGVLRFRGKGSAE